MDDAIGILKAEHGIILEAIDGLEAAALAMRDGARPDPRSLRGIVWFLRAYADGLHHAKEEGLLFPALEANGLHAASGPTESMRREHVGGRALLAEMEAAGADGSGRPIAWKRFACAAEAYANLLRLHIRKEDHCLFAIAESIITPTERGQLARAFARLDASWNARLGAGSSPRIDEVLADCRALRGESRETIGRPTQAPAGISE